MKPIQRTHHKPKKTLWVVLSIVIAIAVILALGMTSESKSAWKQQDSQWRFSAYGDLYALHQFYQKQFPSMEQQAWRHLTDIEPKLGNQTQHLLFLQNTALDQSQFEKLLTWTAKGNHLVMTVSPSQTEPSAIHQNHDFDNDAESSFQAANIAQWAGISFIPQKNLDQRTTPSNTACQRLIQNIQDASVSLDAQYKIPAEYSQKMLAKCYQNINDIALPEGKSLTYWSDTNSGWRDVDRGFVIKPNKNLLWQGKGINGSHIAHFAHGKGSLTVTTSMSAFSTPTDPRSFSSDLNRLDHAYLATYLAQGKSHVWFIQNSTYKHQTENTPLWQKAWQFSPLLSLLIISIFSLFVWRHAYRLGSIQIPNTHQQRQLSHFFRAQGEFLWQRKQHQHALSPLQQQLWQQWQRRIPGLSLMDKNAQLQALSRIYPVEQTDLMLWLHPIPTQLTAQQWRHYLQAHQNIRNAL
ncbi:DUF4350 domain-containing protein [Vitreoscilla stercoraria]|uniref:DUF4350 domain-containing protein n=1 Tax=Vitreoscilla stercoraria TaxID=61 RepID=A0ABY4E9W3_VITST|nr:DUF4350 domain-containing protein [Vitreoscilla stercoraria]UOO92551.1 hypothetical protein LVJ81_00425 [Vitreoscilla stercoraria]